MRWPLAVGCLALLASAAACSDSRGTPLTVKPTAADSADQVLFGVRYLLLTAGVNRGNLVADTVYVLDDETRFDLRRAHVKFTTETGAPQGTMDADRAMYNMRTQVLEGWGHAVVHLEDGRTLTSPHLLYNQMMHRISSDTTFQITRGNDISSGVGFTSNDTFTQFTCMRRCGGATNLLLPSR
jgi:LPS export ABC transporter protein LptC